MRPTVMSKSDIVEHEFLSRSEEAVFATSEIPSLADKFTTTHTLRYAEYNVFFLLALACFCESTSSSSSISISASITLGIRPFRKTVERSAFHGFVFFECFESQIRFGFKLISLSEPIASDMATSSYFSWPFRLVLANSVISTSRQFVSICFSELSHFASQSHHSSFQKIKNKKKLNDTNAGFRKPFWASHAFQKPPCSLNSLF